MVDGYSDGLSWVRGKLAGWLHTFWIPGGRDEAHLLYAGGYIAGELGFTAPRSVWTCVEWGPRYWDAALRRWRHDVVDRITDRSFQGATETDNEDVETIALDSAPANRICWGPFPEDLCYGYPPVEVTYRWLGQDAGYLDSEYMLAFRMPAGFPAFGGGPSSLNAIEVVTGDDSGLVIVGFSDEVAGDGTPVAVAAGSGSPNRWTVHGVAPFYRAGFPFPLPDETYTIGCIVQLYADDERHIYHGLVNPLEAGYPEVQLDGGRSVTVRTRYVDFDGEAVHSTDWTLTRAEGNTSGTGPDTEEPERPAALTLTNISVGRDIQVRNPAGGAEEARAVTRYTIRADWQPPACDAQRVLIVTEWPSFDDRAFYRYRTDGPPVYNELSRHYDGTIVARVVRLDGFTGELMFDSIPGATVRFYVRGENMGDDQTGALVVPGEAASAILFVAERDFIDPASNLAAIVPVTFTGEGAL